MRPAALLAAATLPWLAGCLTPSAPVAAAGGSVAAMKDTREHGLNAGGLLTASSLAPGASAAPGAALGGVIVGASVGSSLRELDRGSAAPAGELRFVPGYVDQAKPWAPPPMTLGNLTLAGDLGRQGLVRDPVPYQNFHFIAAPVAVDDRAVVPGKGDRLLVTGAAELALPPATGLGLVADNPAETAAVRAAFDFPWIATTPVPLFHDYILADTFIDEGHRPWRAEMLKRFAPVVRDCKTRREAILAVARAAETTCGVHYSTKRRRANQTVAESLETKTASCTGLSILLAAAYRSVGIPARLTQVAEWGDRPGNHTWVEVWDTDGWHFVEYTPSPGVLDTGWILEPCARLDPANPHSRVVAMAPGGKETYRLPWAPPSLALGGEDRTAHYQKLAAAAGFQPRAAATPELVILGAPSPESRVARPFRVLDAAGREIAAGMTPGPRDDANNAPRIGVVAGAAHTVEITEPDGTRSRRAVVAGPAATEVR